MNIDQLRQQADAVAEELSALGGEPIPHALRERFIEVRGALYQRGVFEPVLARFDSATVPQASTLEVAERLAAVAESLTPAAP